MGGMALAAKIVIGITAALHLYFLVLEMFLWTTPYGRRVFAMTPSRAETTRVLAMNQGLYNGFLVAGLAWALIADAALARPLATFFLGCVVVAGIVGGATVSKRIFVVQAVPAAIGLALVWCAAS